MGLQNPTFVDIPFYTLPSVFTRVVGVELQCHIKKMISHTKRKTVGWEIWWVLDFLISDMVTPSES